MAARITRITLIGKPGCHLCDEARPIVQRVVAELRETGLSLEFNELNMLEDERLVAEYQEDIPVVLIDGKRHSYWRVDPVRLRTAIGKRASGGLKGLLRRTS